MLDKNGIEIYEEDIVRWKAHERDEPSVICHISFKEFINGPRFAGCPSANTDWTKDCEVIGNTHENIDLILGTPTEEAVADTLARIDSSA